MRVILHLSDLHFGRVNKLMLEPLVQEIKQLNPDLIAVSGDLTQRARVREFKEAKSFLDLLPGAKIVVPGNHDIPLWNPLLRFLCPLSRFRRCITEDLSPLHEDDEIAVLGANTSRSLVVKGGRINIRQVEVICKSFSSIAGPRTKIIVTHHPFDLPQGYADFNLVGRSRTAMENFARCGVDLFLSGHLHVAGTGNTARYFIKGFSALVVQAGTVISTRGRGEMNSFNLVRIHHRRIGVETYTWQPARLRFVRSLARHFHETGNGWVPA